LLVGSIGGSSSDLHIDIYGGRSKRGKNPTRGDALLSVAGDRRSTRKEEKINYSFPLLNSEGWGGGRRPRGQCWFSGRSGFGARRCETGEKSRVFVRGDGRTGGVSTIRLDKKKKKKKKKKKRKKKKTS